MILKEDAGNVIRVQQTIRYDISSDLSFLVRVHPASESNKMYGALKEKEEKKRKKGRLEERGVGIGIGKL